MTDEKRGGPPARGGPGGGKRDDRPGGGRRDSARGGPRKGGGFGKGAPKQERRETYESLKELTRGDGFRIDKYVLAEKGTHKPVKTEYRLTREGLKGSPAFSRLVDAQAAAIAPLPEPEPEPVVEAAEEIAVETEASDGEAGNETEGVEDASAKAGGESVEHVATEEAAT